MTDALAARVAELEASQWWTPAVLAEARRAQLTALARHHAAESPAFAARLADAGLAPDDLAERLGVLPPIGRRVIQAAADGLFARRVPEAHGEVRRSATSGSTGEPLVVRRTARNGLDWQAMVVRHHLWHRVPQPARFAALRATASEVKLLPDWGPPSRHFFASGPMLCIPGTRPLTEQAAMLAAFQPHVLMIYPSNLEGLLREEPDGAPLAPLQVRTIGETLDPALAARVEAHWGCAVIDCYSSEEIGYIALRCPDGPHQHVMAETLIVEILDEAGGACAEGEEGRVVLTDLRNYATPMIRYDIGDRAVAGPACPCGRGLPTIARVAGRERNLILMPDGTRHWPLTGRDGYRDIAPVIQFQMIQTARDLIEVRLVTERPFTARDEAALTAHMRAALGAPFALDFFYYEQALPRGPNGKLEEFVCRVG